MELQKINPNSKGWVKFEIVGKPAIAYKGHFKIKLKYGFLYLGKTQVRVKEDKTIFMLHDSFNYFLKLDDRKEEGNTYEHKVDLETLLELLCDEYNVIDLTK